MLLGLLLACSLPLAPLAFSIVKSDVLHLTHKRQTLKSCTEYFDKCGARKIFDISPIHSKDLHMKKSWRLAAHPCKVKTFVQSANNCDIILHSYAPDQLCFHSIYVYQISLQIKQISITSTGFIIIIRTKCQKICGKFKHFLSVITLLYYFYR